MQVVVAVSFNTKLVLIKKRAERALTETRDMSSFTSACDRWGRIKRAHGVGAAS